MKKEFKGIKKKHVVSLQLHAYFHCKLIKELLRAILAAIMYLCQ